MALFRKEALVGFVAGLVSYLPLLWLLSFLSARFFPAFPLLLLPVLPYALAWLLFRLRPGLPVSRKGLFVGFTLALVLGLSYILYLQAVAAHSAAAKP
ncbi:MAG: hypothetical protein V1787_06300 [Candidatus Micrarchaeota archaeon]